MKYLSFFFLLIVISKSANSQDSLVHFGLELYSNYGKGIPVEEITTTQYFRGRETCLIGYSLGFTWRYSLSKKIKFNSGLIWQKLQDKSEPLPPDPMRGFMFSYRVLTRFDNIEIPLNICYSFNSRFYFAFGLSLTAVILHQEKFLYSNTSDELFVYQDFPFNRINFPINTEFGYVQEFNDFNALNFSWYSQYHIRNNVLSNAIYSMDYLPSRKFLSSGIKVAYLF